MSVVQMVEETERSSPRRRTQLNDLPDHNLYDIMQLVGNDSLPIRLRAVEDMTVQHPLQCALVCKRWRTVGATGLRALDLSTPLTTRLASQLGKRHSHLKQFTVHCVSEEEALPELARGIPGLEQLVLHTSHREVPDGHVYHRASTWAMAEALGMWSNMNRVNLNKHICSREIQDVQVTLCALRKMPSLQHLGICCEERDLGAVCLTVDALTALETLHLECNIPPSVSIGLQKTLRVLVLDAFVGSLLPESLGLLTGLEAFTVIDCWNLLSFPSTLGHLSNLTSLEAVRCSAMEVWPASLQNLQKLRSLVMSNCDSLPQHLGGLESLESLKIDCFFALPVDMGELSRLRKLELVDDRRWSFTLPFSFAHLDRLRLLRFHQSSVVHLPVKFAVGAWHTLTSLEIRKCASLQALPERLGQLCALKELRIEGCQSLVSLPRSFCLLSRLERLYAVDCEKLTEMPESIGMLTSLVELEISGWSSKLQALPESIRSLTRLQVCKISRLPGLLLLPEGIREWQMLRELEVAHCEALTTLPEGLGLLSALKELCIGPCPSLTCLPQSFGSLGSLWLLRLRSCQRLIKLREIIEKLSALRELVIVGCNALEYLPMRQWRERGLKAEKTHTYEKHIYETD